MSATPTLEQVERLARQLPPQDQEKLLQRIREQLQEEPPQPTVQTQKEIHAARIAAAFAIADTLAEQVKGEFDAVEDLRRSREERAARI